MSTQTQQQDHFGHLAISPFYIPMSCHVILSYVCLRLSLQIMCISAPPGTFAIHTRLAAGEVDMLSTRHVATLTRVCIVKMDSVHVQLTPPSWHDVVPN